LIFHHAGNTIHLFLGETASLPDLYAGAGNQVKEGFMSEKKRVLVVDDEPDFASLVQTNLEKEGFDVDVAYNGVEGLEKVKANPPDAIVLDVMMPEKDGYEMCADLKGDETYSDIPVVLLTAVADHVTSTRYSHYDGMNTEADDYLPKPASADDITDSIKRLLDI
jgi:two-component system, OmpR family, alkaline phosphatase synthesis response regulator PhoP